MASTGDILRLESRQWELRNQERQKRTHEKEIMNAGNKRFI